MIKVAGCWELGWLAPITEFDLWHFPLRDFGVDEWIMTPVSGIDRHVTELPDIAAAIAANQDLAPVFLDEAGSMPLRRFQHPQDALYILGKSGYSPFAALGGPAVRIDTPGDSGLSGLLWPHQAIAIALHDRMSKA